MTTETKDFLCFMFLQLNFDLELFTQESVSEENFRFRTEKKNLVHCENLLEVYKHPMEHLNSVRYILWSTSILKIN